LIRDPSGARAALSAAARRRRARAGARDTRVVQASRSAPVELHVMRPSTSLAFNFASSVSLILINKMVFTRIEFDFPMTLSVLHFCCTYCALELMRLRGVFVAARGPMNTELWLLSLCKGLGTPLNNISLRYNSVGVAQLSKLLVTPGVLLAQWVLVSERVSVARCGWLLLCSMGVGLATVSDLNFSAKGTAAVIAWLPCSVGYKSLTSRLCSSDSSVGGLSELQLVHRVMRYAILWSGLAALWLEDTTAITNYPWSTEAVLLLLVSSAGAILVNLSGTFLLSACNPISHVLLGQAKTCALLLSGSAFFGQRHSTNSLVGSAMAMCSIVGYTYSNLVEQDKRFTLFHATEGDKEAQKHE
jgi:hypothetical protein